MSDILETVKSEENCKKTTIIRLANLDWDMTGRYLNYLLDNSYLETYDEGTKGKDSYRITEEGEELLRSMKIVKNICEKVE